MDFINLWRKLPPFKGKKSLIRLLYSTYIKNCEDITFNINKRVSFTVPNLVENVSFNLFFEGIYEEELVSYIVETLPEHGVFIDVGANIGAISIMVALRRPDVTIHAFEASPRIFHYLERNIQQNKLKNIKAVNRAIHTEDNQELSFYAPEDKFGKGSFSNVFNCIAEQVKTIRLDSYFDEYNLQPDLIKVDVEGFEAMVFESMGHFLQANHRPIIVFEFVDWAEKNSNLFQPGDAQQILLNNNFKLYSLNGWNNGKKHNITQVYQVCSYEIIAITDIINPAYLPQL
jgi:FkbM family methyltransferase